MRGVRVDAVTGFPIAFDNPPLVFRASTTAVGFRVAVAATGSSYLLVWQEGVDPTTSLYGAWVTDGGAGTPFLIATVQGASVNPSIGFDGTSNLIVWTDKQGLWTYRTSPSGVVSPATLVLPNPLAGSPGPAVYPADAASCGNLTVLTWQRMADASGSTAAIYSAPLTGGVIGAQQQLTPSMQFLSWPLLACSNGGYLLTWEEPIGVYGVTLNAAGASTFPPLSGQPLATSSTDLIATLASDGGKRALLAYVRKTRAGGSIRTRLLDTSHATCANVPDGTFCTDFNPCTQTDTCQGGVCVGGNPVTCAPPTNQCLNAGACTAMTTGGWVCSYSNKSNGTACNDNTACTTGDTCHKSPILAISQGRYGPASNCTRPATIVIATFAVRSASSASACAPVRSRTVRSASAPATRVPRSASAWAA